MQVKSQGGCLRACTIENEFICRSVLFRPSFKPGQPNCALYHLDHKTFPDGLDTFATPSPIPLLDSGDSSATYFEAGCSSKWEMGTYLPYHSQLVAYLTHTHTNSLTHTLTYSSHLTEESTHFTQTHIHHVSVVVVLIAINGRRCSLPPSLY